MRRGKTRTLAINPKHRGSSVAKQLLDVLFSGVRAFVSEIAEVAREAVRVVLEEVDRSTFGRAATGLVKGIAERYFGKAEALAEEEAEIAAKTRRDGRQSESDADRLREIENERGNLRQELDTARTRVAADDLRKNQGSVIVAPVTDDEASASVGIMAAKSCPECRGTMRIQQGGYNAKTARRSFWWRCTATNAIPCPTIRLDPEADSAKVLRKPNADLDGANEKRHAIWKRPEVLRRTHERLRKALGDADPEIVCPHHLLPMKLLPKASTQGLMLDSYAYACVGVTPNGRGCQYTVPVQTFPQASAVLNRREGKGIIDG
jgi:phenylpyruvate tautomerase PptA (4-oxalocrotonate tautomerase family)